MEWLVKAAEQGMTKAQYTLGWNYGNQYGNYNEALKWMEKAAEKDYTLALLALANVYRQVYQDSDRASEEAHGGLRLQRHSHSDRRRHRLGKAGRKQDRDTAADDDRSRAWRRSAGPHRKRHRLADRKRHSTTHRRQTRKQIL